MVSAIITELRLRRNYLKGAVIDSIYLGGGTPSLLGLGHLGALFGAIQECFVLSENPEITLEANPDDLDQTKLKMFAQSPVNRLSIGVQSFRQEDLVFMHRAHDASQARACIQNALDHGFSNLNVDLIYGTPGLSTKAWLDNLATLDSYEVAHWSCYALTVETKTQLAHQVQKGVIKPPSDQEAEQHFLLLQDFAAKAGFDHYEISNFAKPGHLARHNANYWRQIPYLGLGPSAHSYDGESRSWNIANNANYLKSILSGIWPGTTEILTQDQKYNEYVMTGLRTKWGCTLEGISQLGDNYEKNFLQGTALFFRKGWMEENNQIYTLTKSGKLFADHIASELFVV
jgi:oxygen-independent coproporphyrinogen-3 oxidase